ncbi:MAG: glycoside hydrolase family 5 protein [Akkermansiaceae bacterium]|nr:glycoside hydrolase family 5 protein [Armatimonadota bacterium]
MESSSVVARHGKLRVQGNRIVDKNGKPVQLHGMSLFWSQWIGQYYNADAVNWLTNDWRCTVVRAALAVEPDGYLKNPAKEKQKIITVVDAAVDAGIYVIIDWHDHNAHQKTDAAVRFFGEMARRYGKLPNVIYEPYNEPLDKTSWSKEIKPYHEAVIREIRRYDPDNIIVCGTRTWSQRVDEASEDPIKFSNIAYTLHFYATTHRQSLRDMATTAMKNGVALMVTEFGTTEASGDGVIDYEETKKWWKFLDDNDISWCNWSVADKVEAAAALKPGASARGKWKEAEITASGKFVRDELRRKNPPTKIATKQR